MGKPIYHSETDKIRQYVMPYIANRKLVLDFGCGGDKIVPEAVGIDMRALPGVDHVMGSDDEVYKWGEDLYGKVDVIYSSHFLEHLMFPWELMGKWRQMLKPDGLMILYLPDDNLYDNKNNPEHLHAWTANDFADGFRTSFKSQMQILSCIEDNGYDRYSFCLMARNL